MSQDALPVVDEAGHISMLGSINHKRFSTSASLRHQMKIDVVQVATFVLVIPEYFHFGHLLVSLQ